jgi:quinolinate synthase
MDMKIVNKISVDDDTKKFAKIALERMIEVS